MRAGVFLFTALMAAAATPVLAQSRCADPPPPVRVYLAAHPDWRMRVLEDLPGDEQEWRESKGNACPGMAALDLDGRGRVYAVLLVQRSDTRHGRVVIVGRNGWENLLLKETDGPAQEVLFRISPGKYQDHYDFHNVRLAHDGLAFGEWSGGVVAYYLTGNKVKVFQLSE